MRSRIEKKISTLLSQLACTGRWTRLLTPNDYADLAVLARTLNRFEQHWYAVAEPLAWNFTRVTIWPR